MAAKLVEDRYIVLFPCHVIREQEPKNKTKTQHKQNNPHKKQKTTQPQSSDMTGKSYQLYFRQRNSGCCKFVKRANRRTVQDIVPERPAVCCSRSRRLQCHLKQVPLIRRVDRLQSHQFSTKERTMQADRELYWIAPIEFAAAQPGPWLRGC